MGLSAVLHAFARTHPEEAHSINKNPKFRQSVLSEFERLVREGLPVAELPDVQEPELNTAEEAYAVAQQ
jgi:hypothetical protein